MLYSKFEASFCGNSYCYFFF